MRSGESTIRVWTKEIYAVSTRDGRDSQTQVTEYLRTRTDELVSDAAYRISTEEINCTTRSYRSVEVYYYDLADGLIYGSPVVGPQWMSGPPGSIIVSVIDTACDMSRLR